MIMRKMQSSETDRLCGVMLPVLSTIYTDITYNAARYLRWEIRLVRSLYIHKPKWSSRMIHSDSRSAAYPTSFCSDRYRKYPEHAYLMP
jgi:hypothetical protein